MLKLGKKLENPYSVDNMKKAWNNISSSGRLSEEIEIAPTHYYVKFKPVNEEEREILTDDTTLVLYDYPLDYEIAEEGHYYRDPNVPINSLHHNMVW